MIRKDAGLYCGPRLRKGEVFAYVGLPQSLKDLKAAHEMSRRRRLLAAHTLARLLRKRAEYGGNSLVRNRAPLGPYCRTMPMALWWS